jgi:hypothetical protein
MADMGELSALLEDIRTVKLGLNQIEKRLKTVLSEGGNGALFEMQDVDAGTRDFDVIAVGKSKSQQERIKRIRKIRRELEREPGASSHNIIIESAAKLAAEGSTLTSTIANKVDPRVYYLDEDNHVCELSWWDGSWHFRDVTAGAK